MLRQEIFYQFSSENAINSLPTKSMQNRSKYLSQNLLQ